MTWAPEAHVTALRPGECQADAVDRLSPGLRSCIHDFGFSVVDAFVMHGVRNPSAIRHLVNAVYLGAREEGNRRLSAPGVPGQGLLNSMDDVLRAHGAPAIARRLVSVLRDRDHTIIQREPTNEMVAASCAALSDRGIVTYEEKHRLRLRAALRCGDKRRWGWLDQ